MHMFTQKSRFQQNRMMVKVLLLTTLIIVDVLCATNPIKRKSPNIDINRRYRRRWEFINSDRDYYGKRGADSIIRQRGAPLSAFDSNKRFSDDYRRRE